MELKDILAGINEEISRLRQVRSLLGGGGSIPSALTAKGRKKRVLSPAARARISAAQKKRWAAQKKTAK